MRMLPVLPDESLFSRFCRTTTVYGMSPSSLLTIIFNKPDMNVHPILNSGLKAISLHTSESADQLWHEQTLLPLFAWALPISRNEIMDFNTTPARLNRLCRLSNFSLGQRTLLKFCPVCAREDTFHYGVTYWGTVAKLAMRQPFVLFKGLTFQKLCLPGAFRPGDHHNKMLRPGLCVVHASPQYL